jgi:hypothetical protein
MDRRERIESAETALLAALQGWQADMWTALPAVVQSFDAAAKTAVVQVAIRMRLTSPIDGSQTWVDIKPIADCPVYFPSGGGYTLTFPLAKGDECLLVFSSRCIDAWWQNGGTENIQNMMRMHDLSDGFVFAGISSKPAVQPNISINSVQLRDNAGTTNIELASGTINIKAATAVNVIAPAINLKNAGSALKKLVNETFLTLFDLHVHTSAAAGSPTSAPTVLSSAADKTSVTQAE